ncbi:MAG: hypothetical protein JNJ59_05095 [Deltaproteobacteria bacterium]|nr:hypothetical protein [Deltaproteobacteria bacterium]
MLASQFAASDRRMPSDERAYAVSRWLANQRAMSASMTTATAWLIIDSALRTPLEMAGPKAPIVVQPRFSLWLVGQLGGRPVLHTFADEDSAVAKARALGAELSVPVLVIDRGGAIAERIDPEVTASAVPAARLTLKVSRHEHQWGVFLSGRLIATAPTRERARVRARALKEDPDFRAEPLPVMGEAGPH